MRLRRASPILADRARELRRTATDAEAVLWRYLRGHNLVGSRFHRQRPVGPYIVDFYCPEHCLVIEVDGAQHILPEQAEYDEQRGAYLIGRGLRVLRFSNDEVLHEISAVLEEIVRAIDPHPAPPLPGRGNQIKAGR